MGKATIDFDYYTGFSKPTNIYDPLSGDQYINLLQEFYQANDPTDVPTDPGTRFAWLDAVTRTGTINNYSVSASGGSERTTFYLGGTYLDQSDRKSTCLKSRN